MHPQVVMHHATRLGKRPSGFAPVPRTETRSCAHRTKLQVALNAASPKLIISDVDGTLLNSQQQLTQGTRAAINRAAEAGVPLLVATGKALGPWRANVLPYLGHSLPGVYLQGLLVADADGKALYSKELPNDVLAQCIAMAESHGVTLTAYSSDRIFCERTDEHTDRLVWYKEPTPEAVGPLSSIVSGAAPIYKVIFMAPQPRLDEIRPVIEQAMLGRASLTTALSGMLEVLPLGASKASGVAWLLKHLDVAAADVMAMGDGENDIEMLQLVGLGVAMGNAGAKVKAVAGTVVGRNDDDGAAEAIEKFVLQTRLAPSK